MNDPQHNRPFGPGAERIKLGGEWPTIRAIYALCGSRGWILAPIVALAFLAFVLEGIGIGLLIPLVETVLGSDGQRAAFGPFTELLQGLTDRLPADQRLLLISLLVCLMVLLKTAVIYGHHMLSVWMNGMVGRSLRDRLFDKTFALGILTLQRLGIGRLHNTIDVQVWHVADGLDRLTQILASAAAAAVFLTLLFLISWPLTLGVLLGSALISLIMLVVRRGAQHFGRQLVATNADMSGRIIETLTHHRLVRAFGTEAHETARFRTTTEALRRSTLRTELLKGIANPATELLYVPLMFAAIGLGLAMGLGMPTLLAYLLLLYRLQPHLRNIDSLRVELASFSGPVEDIVTVLEMVDRSAPRSGSRPVPAFAESIRFEQVSFDYGDPESAGLSGVSFEIPKGAVVALVGPSGAGKSTIVGLLYRFFDPTAGRILVDGVPLAELDLAAWRQRLAFAGQDVELMSGTVRDNIGYGSPGATDAEIVAAARVAHADTFIDNLPHGYASEVGARGLTLSGGQRQRLTLARALLRRPDLLVLDEATNALDADAESIVLERLNERSAEMSMLVIAHRLSTVQNADLVVVLDAGRVIEMGPPASLISGAGAFNRLWERQHTIRRPVGVG
jgi:ATP-binding cassette, subfamily B, bacterial MsbA